MNGINKIEELHIKLRGVCLVWICLEQKEPDSFYFFLDQVSEMQSWGEELVNYLLPVEVVNLNIQSHGY